MKRIATGLIATVFLGLAPAYAGDTQTVHGRVVVAAGADSMCTVTEATTNWALGVEGLSSVRITIAPATRGRPFVLTPHLPADLDIFFSGGEVFPDLPERGVAAVHGIVPATAGTADICLVAGGPTSFTYKAG